jgi:hypothetical protein
VLKNKDRIETFILGSSHAYGVDPFYLKSNAFSLANSSQSLQYDYYLLQHYAPYCKNLKNVILDISYFSLNGEDVEKSKSWWYGIYYKIYMDCPYHSDFSKYNFEMSHPIVAKGKIKSLILETINIGVDSLGRGTRYKLTNKEDNWDTEISDAAVKLHTEKDSSLIGGRVRYFEDIARYCLKHSISLFVITTPTWHTYYEQLNKTQLNDMYKHIYALQKKYHFTYYDYIKDNNFIEDDFYDSDHLSDVGAKKFTLMLNDSLFNKKQSIE